MVTSKKNAQLFTEITNDEIGACTSIEEIIARSHSGITVDLAAPLKKKSNNPEILGRLLEMERSIMEKARKKGIIK